MISGYRVEVQTGHLSSATRSGLRGLRTFGKATKKYIQKKENLPGKMVVWIPSSILERALPALVARFQQAQKAKARSVPTSTSTYKAVRDFCVPYV
jgi:Holliday junction resolvase YEN1